MTKLLTNLTFCLLLASSARALDPNPAVNSGASADPILMRNEADNVVWTQAANALQPFGRSGTALLGNYLYCFGSEGLNNAQAFNISTEQWQASTPAPYGNDNWPAVATSNAIYLIGRSGFIEISDQVQRFTPTGGGPTGTWTQMTPYPHQAYGICAAWDGTNKIYAAGGFTQTSSLNTAYSYDITANQWLPIANLPEDMGFAGAAFVQGKFHVMGGNSSGSDHYSYNPITNSWTPEAAVPTAIWFATSSVSTNGSYIFSVGGGGGYASWPATNAVQIYNVATSQWSQETPLPVAYGVNSAAWIGNGKVISGGGWVPPWTSITYRGTGFPGGAPPNLAVTLSPISPPIIIPANGGSFQFNATVQNIGPAQTAFYVWARDRYPDGSYTGNLLGPVQINPPVGVTVTRQRTQVVPSSWPAGVHYYIGYAGLTVGYPAIDADSFSWTKSTTADGGATVWEASNYGELFPGETPLLAASAGIKKVERRVNGRTETRLETVCGSYQNVDQARTVYYAGSGDETDEYTGQLLWQTGDIYGMCNDCATSPEGNYFGLGISLNNQRTELFQSGSSNPLWQFTAGEGATKVALSQNCGVFAFNYLHNLSIFNSSSSTPLWTFDYGSSAWAFPVAVSRDGNLIVGTCMIGTMGHVYAFHPGSSTPVWHQQFEQPPDFGWYGLRISTDNSRISVNGKYTVWILDASTGNTIWTGSTNNSECAVPMSADGSIIAIGSNNDGSVKVLRWNTTTQIYETLWQYYFTGGFSRWCSTVAVSTDGNTIGAGSLVFLTMNSYDGNAAVFDTWGSGTPLWVSSSFGDLVGTSAITDDGALIAFGSWGDINNASPDFRVYQRNSSTPFFTINSPGSINSVAMSTDGSKIFAGGKHVHNRIGGNGGDAYAVSVTAPVSSHLDLNLNPMMPIIIPPGGGAFSYTATVTNDTSISQSTEAWIMVQLPNLNWYGPVLGPLSLTVPGSASLTRLRLQTVPGSAPPGLYLYRGYLGDYPSVKVDSSAFNFSKMATGEAGLGVDDWSNSGEPFPGEAALSRQPSAFSLIAVTPNPFNPTTVASFELRVPSHVSLKVYDVAGRLVAALVDGWREAGSHQATFNGSRLASGVYLYVLKAGGQTVSGKMALIK
jgi:hypothetical protein